MNINNNFSYGNTGVNTDYKNSAGLAESSEGSFNLSDLKTGSSFTGHVISINGDTVSIKLPGNSIIDAIISGSIDLKEGSDVTFEVRSSGSSLSISPLYTNLSNNPTITKALTAAGLPITGDSTQMTSEMMKAGMGIDRNSLTSMFKEISTYPEADAGSIVELHKLGISVTEENLNQLENYKNLSYKLEEGMSQVTSDLNNLIDELDSNGLQEKAAVVFKNLISIGTGDTDFDISNSEASETSVSETLSTEYLQKDNQENLEKTNVNSAESASEKALKLLASISGKNSTSNAVISSSLNFDGTNIEKVIEQLDKSIEKGDTAKIHSILQDKNLRQYVLEAVSEKMEIKPEDVADKENVKELYSRLQKELGLIRQTLSENGLQNSNAAISSENMNNNLDFLNQINHMYSFVQLPLKMSDGDAHGDLYVYSNGKKLSGDDSKVTALLHLDMEHLGPLDVYVALDTSGYDKKLSTNFTVADDSILDFLESHMDELNKRLEDKGYKCSTNMSVKSANDSENTSVLGNNGAMGPVLDMTDSLKLSEYSFDVRT